jgi:hypothetical protein
VGDGLDLINLENTGSIGTQNKNPPVLRTPPPTTPAPTPAPSIRGDGSDQSEANSDLGSNSLNGHFKTPMNTGAIPKNSNRQGKADGRVSAPLAGPPTSAATTSQLQVPTLYQSATSSSASTRAGNEKFRKSMYYDDLPTPAQRCSRDHEKLVRYMMHVYKKYSRDDHAGVQRSVDRLNRYFREVSCDIKDKEAAADGLSQQEAKLFQITSRDLKKKIDEICTQLEQWGYNVQRYDWPPLGGTLGNPRRTFETQPTPLHVVNAITPVATVAPPNAPQVKK